MYIGNFSISYIAKTLRAESHCGGKELCRRCDPPQAENPVSRILFLISNMKIKLSYKVTGFSSQNQRKNN